MTYNQFSIQSVKPDLSQKQIVIETNFKVDVTTVDLKTVAYYNYDKKQLEVYKLKVDGKKIFILLDDYPANESRYYLKVSGIKDALGRSLSSVYDDYIKFRNDVKTKLEITSPLSRETLKERAVDIRIKATELIDNLRYRIEISSDNMFFSNKTTLICHMPKEFNVSDKSQTIEINNNQILATESNIPIVFNNGYFVNDEITLSTTIDKDGQLYIRARAELSDEIVGDWCEFISFNIYTIKMESLETTFLEDYLTTDIIFDDSLIESPNIQDKTTNCYTPDIFYFEFNKAIDLPDSYEVNSEGYIRLRYLNCKRKEIDAINKKDRVRFELLVDPDDINTLILSPVNHVIQDNNVYSISINNIVFADSTTLSIKEDFITSPTDNYFVKVEDVQSHIKGLGLDDSSVIGHIIDAGKTAKYWMKRRMEDHKQMPEFTVENIEEDYYPFYMFIKHQAIVESLKEYYVEALTNPFKWRDLLSDLEREEEYDLDAIKALIDDYQKEADDWLELVITITADPKWALRGKYCYSTYYTWTTNPFHDTHWGKPPHDTSYRRGF